MEKINMDNSFGKKLIRGITKTPLHFILILICLLWMIPSVGLFVSSFRPRHLIQSSGWWHAFKFPITLTLENYGKVLTQSGMGLSFFNSLLIAIPATIFPILIAAFAAYAFSWMNFKGKNILFLIVIGLLVVPLQMTLIPNLKLFNMLGLTGTFGGIWLAHTAYGIPFAIYLLRNFIGELPGEMMESAFLDGATHSQIFFRLILPTSIPAIASLSIFQFMWVWNDLLIALIFLGGFFILHGYTVNQIMAMVN